MSSVHGFSIPLTLPGVTPFWPRLGTPFWPRFLVKNHAFWTGQKGRVAQDCLNLPKILDFRPKSGKIPGFWPQIWQNVICPRLFHTVNLTRGYPFLTTIRVKRGESDKPKPSQNLKWHKTKHHYQTSTPNIHIKMTLRKLRFLYPQSMITIGDH